MSTNVTEHSPARAGKNQPARRRLRPNPRRVAEFAWVSATMTVALLAVAWVLQLWDAKLHVPIVPGGDALLNMSVLKGLIQHGWYFTNSSIGAPFGQELYDYSAFDGDNLQFLLLRFLAFWTSDPAALLNVYYVLGYPLVAGVTYAVLRALGISRPTSLVSGVLFCLLPYHFARGEGHLFLGTYFAVPAGGWLVLRTLLGQRVLPLRPGVPGLRGRTSWASAATVAAVIVTGASTLYYAVFTILLVAIAAVIRLAVTRSWRAALPGVAVAAAIGLALLVNISPGIVYQSIHGHNAAIAERQPVESEIYSLSLTQLVLPIQGHRIPAFARAYEKHQASTQVRSEGGMQMGLLLSASFLSLLALLAVRALRGEVRLTGRGALAAGAAIGAATAFLCGTFGGLSALIAYYISPQIRGWNRLTPFIAFFALVGLALAIDGLRARLLMRRHGRLLAPVLVAAVGVIGVLDQTSKTFLPPYASVAADWRSDARFVAELERELPRNVMILQLPFHAFPETSGTNQMADYDLFKGYVHADDLRWSYGAMKGRPADWTDEAAARPLSWVIPAAVAEGFAGVYVDRAAYDDHGTAVEAQVRRALGDRSPTATSSDGRLAFYDAARLARRLRTQLSAEGRAALGDALVRPLDVEYGAGFYPEEYGDGQAWRWVATNARMTIDNPDDTPRRDVLVATARASAGAVVQIKLPGRPVQIIRFTDGERRLRLSFVAAPDDNVVTLHVRAPKQGGADPRDLRMQLVSPRVIEGDVPAPPRP